MDTYVLILILIGISGLTMAWLPQKLSNVPLSYPIIFLAGGAILYKLPIGLPLPDITKHNEYIVRLTEMCVIISLMGTGLKIDTDISLKTWAAPLKLIIITMVLSIASLTYLGWWLLSLPFAAALLLGSSLAPTDPVLASDVQVGPPNEEKEDHVRFTLSAEAGLNDGMAFPFVWMAVILCAGATEGWFEKRLLYNFLYKILVGILSGYLLGKLLSYIFFSLPETSTFPKIREGFVALAATFLVYGITEAIHAYGFLAVFVTGLTMSRKERHHKYHKEMHHFIDQIERFILVLVLIPFGGALVNGLLSNLSWMDAIVAASFIFLIRPIAGMAAMLGIKSAFKEKLIISFMAIRGIGSFYYLSFGMKECSFKEQVDELWAVTSLIVLTSILIHGILATPFMKHLETRRSK